MPDERAACVRGGVHGISPRQRTSKLRREIKPTRPPRWAFRAADGRALPRRSRAPTMPVPAGAGDALLAERRLGPLLVHDKYHMLHLILGPLHLDLLTRRRTGA